MEISRQDQARLQTARNLWLATVRANGSPHLVPIWFVWTESKAYICTSRHSVKARNIAQNPRIAFSLEDGDDPLVMEGTAKILPQIPEHVAAAFEQKFEWNIRGDSAYDVIVEITPARVVL